MYFLEVPYCQDGPKIVFKFMSIFILKIIYDCMCACMCVCPSSAHMEVRGQLCGVSAILSSFTKVPGIELRSLDLCSKHLYLLSSLANPSRQSCLFVFVTGSLYLALAVLEFTYRPD